MIIYEPKLVVTEHYCCLETNFEANGKNGTLWYKFPIEFKEYIVVEQSDSAIVALMVLAMKNGEDIYIGGLKVKAVSGVDSSKLKIQRKK